jgi:hypothetical protein
MALVETAVLVVLFQLKIRLLANRHNNKNKCYR